MMQNYKSPAKINLFLNITKKRSDGYHEIQSIFQLIDLHDEISINIRKDSQINLNSNKKKIIKDNLIFTAIKKFLEYTKLKRIGMDIFLKKNIPIGSGLGGGSSNAAIILLAMNKIYNSKLRVSQLRTIANSIGSDVTFFLYGTNAWVEGIGDIVTPIYLNPAWFILIHGKHKVSTSKIFSQYRKNDSSKNLSYDDYLNNHTTNDLEDVVFELYPSIYQSYKRLSKYGKARMTGSGGTVFLPLSSYDEARKIILLLPKTDNPLIVKSLIT